MKKLYIQPAMYIIATTPSQMIATSIKVGGTVTNDEDINFVKGEAADDGEYWNTDMDW